MRVFEGLSVVFVFLCFEGIGLVRRVILFILIFLVLFRGDYFFIGIIDKDVYYFFFN